MLNRIWILMTQYHRLIKKIDVVIGKMKQRKFEVKG